MKTIFRFIVILVVGTIIGTHSVYAEKTRVLKLVVPSPPGDFPMTYLNDELAKRFNKKAGDRYRIEVHPGAALAQLPEYFDAVRIGAVEMACSPWGFFSFMDARLGLVELPFLINNTKAAAYAAKKYLPVYDKILQQKFNAKGLGFMTLSGVELLSNKPVKKLEDWKGLLIGAISPPTAMMVQDLKGSPMTLQWPDMYESLQKHIIDAAVSSTHAQLVTGMVDVTKYSTIFFGMASWLGISINLDVWNEMPEDIQTILYEEVQTSVDWINKLYITSLDVEDISAFKEKGVEVYVLPKEERERWIKATAQTREGQLKKFGEFGQTIKHIAAEANSKYPY